MSAVMHLETWTDGRIPESAARAAVVIATILALMVWCPLITIALIILKIGGWI